MLSLVAADRVWRIYNFIYNIYKGVVKGEPLTLKYLLHSNNSHPTFDSDPVFKGFPAVCSKRRLAHVILSRKGLHMESGGNYHFHAQ